MEFHDENWEENLKKRRIMKNKWKNGNKIITKVEKSAK